MRVHSASETHRAHQGVEHTDSEGRAAGEGLCEVQLRVGVVVIILVQELNVRVVHWESESISELETDAGKNERTHARRHLHTLILHT